MNSRLLLRSIATLRDPHLTTIGAAVVALALTLGAGCKKSEPSVEISPAASQVAPAPTPPPPPTPPATTYNVGDEVDVEWNSSWWKAEVLAVNGDAYQIHYVGWSSSWDETVTPNRIRARTDGSSVGTEAPAASAATAAAAAPVAKKNTAAATAWKVGDKVDINWKDQWWQGEVIGVTGNKYKVHYTGWSSSWDETVGANRLRAWTSTAKRGSGS